MSPRKLLALSGARLSSLRLHLPLRAEDADDRRAPGEGRSALGSAGGPRRLGATRARQLRRRARPGRRELAADAAVALSGRFLRGIRHRAAARAAAPGGRRLVGSEARGLRPRDARRPRRRSCGRTRPTRRRNRRGPSSSESTSRAPTSPPRASPDRAGSSSCRRRSRPPCRRTPPISRARTSSARSTADIARLDLERGRGHLLLLQRSGIWWLEQPFKDLADPEAASRLAGDLSALRVIEFQAPDSANLAALGLSPPLYRVMAADPKGKTTTVEFGSTRSDGNSLYARRDGQVFTVGSSITEELSKEAEAFRDKSLVRFDRARASAVDGAFGAKSLALARAKDGGWTAAGQARRGRLRGRSLERDPGPEEPRVRGRAGGAGPRRAAALRDGPRRLGGIRALGDQDLRGLGGSRRARLAPARRVSPRRRPDGRAARRVREGRYAAALRPAVPTPRK